MFGCQESGIGRTATGLDARRLSRGTQAQRYDHGPRRASVSYGGGWYKEFLGALRQQSRVSAGEARPMAVGSFARRWRIWLVLGIIINRAYFYIGYVLSLHFTDPLAHIHPDIAESLGAND